MFADLGDVAIGALLPPRPHGRVFMELESEAFTLSE